MHSDDTDALSNYWDALSRGDPETASGALDTDSIEFIRRVRRASQADPQAGAREQALQAVMRDIERRKPHLNGNGRADALHTSVVITGPFTPPAGASRALSPTDSRHLITRGLRGTAAYLGLAALLLIALGFGYLVADGFGRSPQTTEQPVIGAPAGTPGTPLTDDAANTTLVDIALPAELRPGGDQFLAVFRSVTAVSNSRTDWLANACCPGPQVIYVLAGSYTAQAMNGPLTVYRAGVSAPESLEPQTDVTLGPGDLAFVDQGASLLLANRTSTPVRLLTWQLTTESSSGPSPQTDIPTGWTLEANVYQYEVALSSGGLTLRLQKVVLEPADIVETPPRAFSQALKSGGAGAFVRRDDNAITNPGTESVELYLLSVVPNDP